MRRFWKRSTDMPFLRHYRSWLIFAVFLIACSVLVVRQFSANQHQHVELREAFILLYNRGYQPQAEHLYEKLLAQMPRLSDQQLLDDFQRTITLVNPTRPHPENLIWKYHWTVSNEMERRSVKALTRALKLADQP